jgi:hypothetical protein
MMMQQASKGASGGGGVTLAVRPGSFSGIEAMFLEWLKMVVRDNGGDARVFGGG